MRVFVYFNLHKKVWSVKALEGPEKGRVIAHKEIVHLRNAIPKVSQKGRERVLRERRKNVHAGIVGELIDGIPENSWVTNPVFPTYNPYLYSTFVEKDTETEWLGAALVAMVAGAGVMAMDLEEE